MHADRTLMEKRKIDLLRNAQIFFLSHTKINTPVDRCRSMRPVLQYATYLYILIFNLQY